MISIPRRPEKLVRNILCIIEVPTKGDRRQAEDC